MNKIPYAKLTLFVVAIAAFLLTAETWAATSSGTVFDSPLEKLQDIFTGPIAFAFSLIGVIVAAITLVIGGEINEFAKRIMMAVLALSILLLAVRFLGNLFGITSALVSG